MSGMPQNLFGPSTVVHYGDNDDDVELYSEVFDLSEFTSIALRLRIYGIFQATSISAQIQTANDPLGHDWEDLGSAATGTSIGATEVYIGNASSSEFAGYARAKITVAKSTAGDANFGGTFQAACVIRE